jgi:CheY-like chemotaxis protein
MNTKQILVIDDEDDIRQLIQTCLEIMGGWNVLTATSGHQGLLVAQSSQPDAILLDVMMPDMDGLATFQKLQANPLTKHIPVILLTARGRTSDQRLFTQLGIKNIISKPFNPKKLAFQVAAALNYNILIHSNTFSY